MHVGELIVLHYYDYDDYEIIGVFTVTRAWEGGLDDLRDHCPDRCRFIPWLFEQQYVHDIPFILESAWPEDRQWSTTRRSPDHARG